MNPSTQNEYGVATTRHAIARRMQATLEETESAAPPQLAVFPPVSEAAKNVPRRDPRFRYRPRGVWSRYR